MGLPLVGLPDVGLPLVGLPDVGLPLVGLADVGVVVGAMGAGGAPMALRLVGFDGVGFDGVGFNDEGLLELVVGLEVGDNDGGEHSSQKRQIPFAMVSLSV